MMRASLLITAAVGQARVCQGEQCFIMDDLSGLIQSSQTVMELVQDEPDEQEGTGWTFENSFLDNLVHKLSPDAVTQKIDSIVEDSDISLESAQKKLYGLAHKFGTRLNKTMDAAQERIASLQRVIEKGREVKDQSILQAVSMITEMGDAAVDVAEKVTAEVEEAQLKVRQMKSLLQSEMIQSRRQEMEQSLDVAMRTLMGLMHALQDSMGMREDAETDLMQLNHTWSVPDASLGVIDYAEELLQQTDKLLDNAKVYIEFVQTRVDSVRDEAVKLTEAVGNKTDASFDLGNKVAGDVIEKLGEIDGMLTGKLSIIDAKVLLSPKHNSAAQVAMSVFVCLLAGVVV